jgi:hypothetical protein
MCERRVKLFFNGMSPQRFRTDPYVAVAMFVFIDVSPVDTNDFFLSRQRDCLLVIWRHYRLNLIVFVFELVKNIRFGR